MRNNTLVVRSGSALVFTIICGLTAMVSAELKIHRIGVLGIAEQPAVPWSSNVLFEILDKAATFVNTKILDPATHQIALQKVPYTVDSLDELSTDDGYPVDQAVRMYYPSDPTSKVEAFILSPEALLLENVAQLSEVWQVPVFAGGSQLGLITETSFKYDNLQSLVNIGISKNQLALAVISVIGKFHWQNITIVSDLSSTFYEELANRIDMILRTPSNYTQTTQPIYARRYWLSIPLTEYAQADYEADVKYILRQASMHSRIFILSMQGDKVRTFMYHAYRNGYCTADYSYFAFEPFTHPTYGNFGIVPLLSASTNGMVMDSTVTLNNLGPIKYARLAHANATDYEIANITQAYRSLIKITLSIIPNPANADLLYSSFPFFLSFDSKKVKIPYATWWAANRENENGASFIYSSFYYDAVLLLGYALRYAIANPQLTTTTTTTSTTPTTTTTPAPGVTTTVAPPVVSKPAAPITPSILYHIFSNWDTYNGNQVVIGDPAIQETFVQQNYALGDDCVKMTEISYQDFDITLTDWIERGTVILQSGQPQAILAFGEQDFEWSHEESHHAPPNEPACGFQGEKCYVRPAWVIPLVIAVCSIVGFFILVALLVALYRHATQLKRLKQRPWYINNEDVKILAIAGGFDAYSSYLMSAGKSTASAAAVAAARRTNSGAADSHAQHPGTSSNKSPHRTTSERHTSAEIGGTAVAGGKSPRITFGGVNPTGAHLSAHAGGLHRSTLRQRGARGAGGANTLTVTGSMARLPMPAGSTTSAQVDNLVSTGQFSLAVVKHKNLRCAGKRLLLVRLFFTKAIVREIEHLMSINHENLVRTFGFVSGPPAVWIVKEYFTKGSVADLLQNPNMELDWNFKLSILEDIARGTKALHEMQPMTKKAGENSCAHGQLRTTNCLVNDRFGVKISGFGVPTMRQMNFNERARDSAYANSEMCKLLWVAPELLLLIEQTTPAAEKVIPSSSTAIATSLAAPPINGDTTTKPSPQTTPITRKRKPVQRGIYFGKTKEGDTYSFGIITAELWSHLPPYHEQMVMGVPIATILSSVQVGTSPPTRPKVEEDIPLAPRALLQLMKECWVNERARRPSFIEISRQLQHITQRIATTATAAQANNSSSSGVGVNILDSLLRQMELHSKRLESIVRERTQELAESKAETEKVLHELVPPTITKRLLAGADIEPERFENVTVCISRIVGFHKLCSTLSAIHCSSFFNKLCTLLDSTIADHPRVLKVDVVLDMYVCAAGVPVPSRRHAWEICEVALALQHRSAMFHSKFFPPGFVIQLRCGIHSGSVVAGIVGSKVPRYGLYGPTITATLALEAHALPGHILLSLPAYKAIRALPKNRFVLEQTSRRLEVFGVGLFATYWLRGHADKKDSESIDSVVEADDDDDEEYGGGKTGTNFSVEVDEEMSKMMEMYRKPVPHATQPNTLPAGVKSALGGIANTITEEEEEEGEEAESESVVPAAASELYVDAVENPNAASLKPSILGPSGALALNNSVLQDRSSNTKASVEVPKSGRKRSAVNKQQRTSKNRNSNAKSSVVVEGANSAEKLAASTMGSSRPTTLAASKRISQNSTTSHARTTAQAMAVATIAAAAATRPSTASAQHQPASQNSNATETSNESAGAAAAPAPTPQ